MKILIIYYSKTGHTLEAANAAAHGIRSAGSEVNIIAVNDFVADTLGGYDGLIIGSPCWAGSVTGAGIARPIKKLIDTLPPESLVNKRCGAISVYATAGGKNTVRALKKIMLHKGCGDFKSGPSVKAGVPMSVWKGPSVNEHDEELLKDYGTQFVA